MPASLANAPDFLIPIAFFSLAIAINLALRRRRRSDLQSLADRFGLADRGGRLPSDFPVEAIAGQSSPWVRDVFSGQVGGDTLLVMDTSVGWGRQSYTRTIVGRRFDQLPPEPTFPKHLVYQQLGQWRIAFYKRSLFGGSAKMSPELVEHLWKVLGGSGAPALQPCRSGRSIAPAEIFIPPRKPGS